MGKRKNYITELPPEPKYRVHPWGKDSEVVLQIPERPNWWFRIWMFVCFGWRFEPI